MPKSEYIRARIEPDLKEDVSSILAAIGLSHTDIITMLYKSISAYRGIPETLTKVPNAETRAALDDAMNRKNLISYNSKEEMYESWLNEPTD